MRRISSVLVIVALLIVAASSPATAAPPPLAPAFDSASVVDPFCYRVVAGVTRCSPEATAAAATGRATFANVISGTGEATVDTLFVTSYTQRDRKPAAIVFTVDIARAIATRSLIGGHAQLVAFFSLSGDACGCGTVRTVPLVSSDGTTEVTNERLTVTVPTAGLSPGSVSVSVRFAAFVATEGGVDESRIDADITVSDVRAA